MSVASTLLRANRIIADRKRGRPKNVVPSQRDQDIFQRVVVHCQRQADVAADIGVTGTRISQIVSRVRRWLAEGGQGDAETLTALAQIRLERQLAKARHETLYERLLREADRQAAHPKQTTVRIETRRVGQAQRELSDGPPPSALDGGPAAAAALSHPTSDDEARRVGQAQPKLSAGPPMAPSDDDEVTKVITTIRDVPLNVQLIKAAQRSAIELARLAELEPIPAPQASTMPSDNELFVAIYEVLCDWRRRAEHAGRVTTADNVPVLIEHFLASLLGRDCGYGLDGEAAVREVIRAFAFGRREPAECAGATGDAGQETGDRGQEAGDKGQWTGATEPTHHSPTHHSPPHHSPTHHSPTHHSTPPTNFPQLDPAALAEEIVPPPGGQRIPNPIVFSGSDESLPPLPPDQSAPSPAKKTENISENQPAAVNDRNAAPGKSRPAPMPPGSYMFGPAQSQSPATSHQH